MITDEHAALLESRAKWLEHDVSGMALSKAEILGLIARMRAAEARNKELEAVVAKLPKTANGVSVVPGMMIYPPCGHSAPLTPDCFSPIKVNDVSCWGAGCRGEEWGENDYRESWAKKYKVEECYSTHEAAIAAKAEQLQKAGG